MVSLYDKSDVNGEVEQVNQFHKQEVARSLLCVVEISSPLQLHHKWVHQSKHDDGQSEVDVVGDSSLRCHSDCLQIHIVLFDVNQIESPVDLRKTSDWNGSEIETHEFIA